VGIAVAVLRSITARPWLVVGAALGAVVLFLAGVWICAVMLEHVHEHGVRGLLEAVCRARPRPGS
jgi:hypothetical protein